MLVYKDLLSRITVNPQVMVGKPTIRGLRITVEQILRALAGGVSREDLFDDYGNSQKRISHERFARIDAPISFTEETFSFLDRILV